VAGKAKAGDKAASDRLIGCAVTPANAPPTLPEAAVAIAASISN
jgi:hypothetical protein